MEFETVNITYKTYSTQLTFDRTFVWELNAFRQLEANFVTLFPKRCRNRYWACWMLNIKPFRNTNLRRMFQLRIKMWGKNTSNTSVVIVSYMIWYDMIWYDMIWYDMIWYDMIWWYMICLSYYMIYHIHIGPFTKFCALLHEGWPKI